MFQNLKKIRLGNLVLFGKANLEYKDAINQNSKISADDLAKAGGKKRKSRERKKRENQTESEISSKEYQRSSDQRRVFLHITSWCDWKSVFLGLTLLNLMSAVPFFTIYIALGDSDQFNPKDFINFITVPFLFSLMLFITSIYMIKRKVSNEKKWLDNLPFELKSYPDFFVYRSYSVFDVQIEFKNKKPSFEFFADLLGTAPLELIYEEIKQEKRKGKGRGLASFFDDDEENATEETRETIFKFEVSNSKASKFNRHRRWARRWVHKVCDVHFKALHQKYPIKRIILVNGTAEFDFDWWVPRKKTWWLRMG